MMSMLFPLESNLFRISLLKPFYCYHRLTGHLTVMQKQHMDWSEKQDWLPIFSDIPTLSQVGSVLGGFHKLKENGGFRRVARTSNYRVKSLLFYLLNYPEIYIYFYILLFPTNIVYHKSKSFSTQFLWFTFNMYKAKSCLVYVVI